jgi:hypothetical protein
MIAGEAILTIPVANWIFRMQTWALHGFVWQTFIFNPAALGLLLTFPAALALRSRSRGLAFSISWLSHPARGLSLLHPSVLVLAWPWVAKGGFTAVTALLAPCSEALFSHSSPAASSKSRS